MRSSIKIKLYLDENENTTRKTTETSARYEYYNIIQNELESILKEFKLSEVH